MRRQSHLARNLFLCLLASQLSRLLLLVLAAKGYQWQTHDLAMHISQCALILLVFSLISYQQVAAKCIGIAWLGFEIIPLIEAAVRIFIVRENPYVIVAQAVMAITFATWYACRSYSHVSDELDDTHMFICRLKPRGLQDVLLALLPSGLGGIAVYYKGQLWHYRHGIMQVTEFKNQQRYVIGKVGLPNPEAIEELNKLKGTKWAAHKNCLTTLYPIAKWGSPLFRVM